MNTSIQEFLTSLKDKITLTCAICNQNPQNHQTSCVHNINYDYWFVNYNYSKISPTLFHSNNKNIPWFQQYLDLLPLKNKTPILSIGEGNTPLIPSKIHHKLYIKDEGRNPSGSFKDRETALLLPALKAMGYNKLSIASSGNAALSTSLYGNIYNTQIKCYVPKGTSNSKKQLVNIFGAEMIEIGNYYEDCYKELQEISNKSDFINISAGINPLKDQGNKIISYEIFNKINVPDFILIPSANGCLLSGIYLGFLELKKLGLIKKLPTLIAIQIKNGAPLKTALENLKTDYEILETCPDSLAEGIIALESYCSPKALKALKETNGFVYSLEETSIKKGMQYAIQQEGIFPEWTSATAFATYLELLEQNKISKTSKTVIILTGSGLKEIHHIASTLQ